MRAGRGKMNRQDPCIHVSCQYKWTGKQMQSYRIRRLKHEHTISSRLTELNSVVCELFIITLHRPRYASLSRWRIACRFFLSLLKNSVRDGKYCIVFGSRDPCDVLRAVMRNTFQQWNVVCHSVIAMYRTLHYCKGKQEKDTMLDLFS